MGKNLKDLHKMEGESVKISENISTDNIKTAEAKIGKYRGMNENQLMSELMSKMNNAKESGNFDAEELDKFYYQMSPHLSYEQRNRMRSLINMLKNNG